MALGGTGDKAARAVADGPAARGLRPRVYAPPPGPPRVLHADAALVAVEKPAGLLTVPGRGEGMADCLVARVAADFPGARAVHRLDLDTSGVVVLALTAEAHRHLGLQFERRRAEKRYVAVVAGGPEAEAGRIEAPLAVDWERRPRQRIDPAGRPAVTDWRRLSDDPAAPPRGRARLALAPLTGRSHQLRVHLAEAGWPILGDPIYADADAYAAAPRMLLHAEALALRHPDGGAPIRFEAPAPF